MARLAWTSDMVSGVVIFLRKTRKAIAAAGNTSLTGYRILSCLIQCSEGLTGKELSRILGVTQGAISTALKSLYEQNYASNALNGSSWAFITAEGIAAVRTCDTVIADLFDDFFTPIGESYKADLLSGSMVTASIFGESRIDEGHFFAEYAALVSAIRTEQYITKYSYDEGVTLGEFRVLLLLAEMDAPLRPTDIRHELVAHRSEVSSWCNSAERKGLVISFPEPLDKRGYVLQITEKGLEAAKAVDSRTTGMSERPSNSSEYDLFNRAYRNIMDKLRG